MDKIKEHLSIFFSGLWRLSIVLAASLVAMTAVFHMPEAFFIGVGIVILIFLAYTIGLMNRDMKESEDYWKNRE